MKSEIEKLDSIHPDLISTFLTNGDCEGIPQDVKLFLQQLQWSAEIFEYERNITRAAKKLRLRINAEQHIKIEERTCMARIYQAINYFQVDCNVPIKVWESNFANKYEDLAKLCALNRDYKGMKACYDAALECRRRSSEIAEADKDLGVLFLISPELTPEQLGFSRKNLKEIAAKHNQGFYHTLIDSLPIETKEKRRLLRDADIQEAEIVEEIPND
ncbi:hypothetical protein C7120_13135 [Prevotella sp. oral taxon 376]|uniref:hypothetical protein n=1 Tax=Prevotella sp. oral taxon 376 TaxID=712466 RepID=UPI000D1D8BD8|nr:hypothetical protein [Prevotella sp. oral taxon 376]PTL32404.1 hypothetical protein C7120_13135 [Prevotella sp. oral taxon 376]